MPDNTTQELDALFKAQRKAFALEPMPALETRLDRLRRLEQALVGSRNAFRKSLAEDFSSHHVIVTDLFETGGVLGRNRFIQENLPEWMKPSPRTLNHLVHGSSAAKVIRQPKGVMGNIGPWNFPVESTLVMVSDMLAGGNRVIVKASELAPATGEVLQRVIREAFDPAELCVVNGDVAFAQYFATLPWDHLTYTGGGRAAKSIMAAAAPNLTPLTLELGGKNPTLFTNSGFEPGLVERYLYFRIFKGGQVCTSPDYVLAPRERMGEWVELAKRAWSGMYPHYVGHADATGAINRRHYDRVLGYVAEARAAGVQVVSLNGDEPDPKSLQIPLYVVVDPPESLAVSQDETFGPVIALKPYDSIEAAIRYINDRPCPLAAYFVGRQSEEIETFVANVISGGVGVNVFGFQGADPTLPFGGVGASGMGCHSGYEGFLNYTHQKSVFYCSDDNPLMLSLKGPYGEMAHAFADATFGGPA